MGGRLSVPQGPAGLTEASRATPRRPKLTARTLLAPAGIVVLAGIFFVYSRTSIQAAKINAKRAREADGGSISWRNEGLRRHGSLEKPKERTLFQQLTKGNDEESDRIGDKSRESSANQRKKERNPIEEGIRQAQAKRIQTELDDE